MPDKNQILQLIKESVNTTDPKAMLILYGSYARGDYNESSDIELLILIDKEKVTHKDRVGLSYPLYDIQFQYGILVNSMICTGQSWETKHRATPFYENVTREGVVL